MLKKIIITACVVSPFQGFSTNLDEFAEAISRDYRAWGYDNNYHDQEIMPTEMFLNGFASADDVFKPIGLCFRLPLPCSVPGKLIFVKTIPDLYKQLGEVKRLCQIIAGTFSHGLNRAFNGSPAG